MAVLLITSVWAQNYRPENPGSGLYVVAGIGQTCIILIPDGVSIKEMWQVPKEALNFDDSAWQVVSTRTRWNWSRLRASGGRNYQGIAWYRKHFVVPAAMQGQLVTVYFEAIMGKQEIFLNGKLVRKQCRRLSAFFR